MKAFEFIKQVRNEGKALRVFRICIVSWEDDRDGCDNPKGSDWEDDLYFDHDEAVKAMEALAETKKAEFGERLEIQLMYADVAPDDLGDVDWQAIDELEDAEFADSDLIDLIEAQSSYPWDMEEWRDVTYKYESVEGALLIVWSWNRYTGYARDIKEIREGIYGEDESICIKRDKVFVPQVDVLVKKEELEGLSREDRRSLIEQRLGESQWKWTMKAENAIRRYIHDEFDKDEDN